MAVIPKWSIIRTIGHSRIAKATILIPIVGYFVIFNEQLTHYLNLIPTLSNKPADPTLDTLNLTRLICLYIGLFCIGIGSIIFIFACPEQIADHDNEHHFITKQIDIMTPLRFGSIQQNLRQLRSFASPNLLPEIDRLIAAQLSDSIGIADARTEELRGGGLRWTDWINRNKNTISESLSILYNLLDQNRWDFRAIISVLYLIGFGFLIWPSSEVFYRTVTTLIGILRSLSLL